MGKAYAFIKGIPHRVVFFARADIIASSENVAGINANANSFFIFYFFDNCRYLFKVGTGGASLPSHGFDKQTGGTWREL